MDWDRIQGAVLPRNNDCSSPPAYGVQRLNLRSTGHLFQVFFSSWQCILIPHFFVNQPTTRRTSHAVVEVWAQMYFDVMCILAPNVPDPIPHSPPSHSAYPPHPAPHAPHVDPFPNRWPPAGWFEFSRCHLGLFRCSCSIFIYGGGAHGMGGGGDW